MQDIGVPRAQILPKFAKERNPPEGHSSVGVSTEVYDPHACPLQITFGLGVIARVCPTADRYGVARMALRQGESADNFLQSAVIQVGNQMENSHRLRSVIHPKWADALSIKIRPEPWRRHGLCLPRLPAGLPAFRLSHAPETCQAELNKDLWEGLSGSGLLRELYGSLPGIAE